MAEVSVATTTMSSKEAMQRQKVHKAAEDMATLHYGQFAERILEAGSHDAEDNQAKKAFGMFLAKGLGRGLARSAGKRLVRDIEGQLLKGAGLKEKRAVASHATKAYETVKLKTKPNMKPGTKGVK